VVTNIAHLKIKRVGKGNMERMGVGVTFYISQLK
jgi:hypothetical protein